MELYRKTYAEIDLDAIKSNIAAARANIGPKSRMIAVVKADAYGHGAVAVSHAAEEAGASMLAVALAEEAIELREAGISLPILVIGHSNVRQMQLAAELELELCMFDCEEIRRLQKIAWEAGRSVAIHLKIDSGMGRIGIRTMDELRRIVATLRECPNVALTGVFTHFACADQRDKTFTLRQNQTFMEFIAALHAAGLHPAVHAANSAATIDLPEYAYDFVRYGISMYGYYPSCEVCRKNVALKPAMQVRAEISHVKTVPAGTPVGYGATYIAPREAQIATVQIGYGDGYPRLLSGRGRMIVSTVAGPAYAGIVGRVCMDQTMIDVSGMEGVRTGNMATVLGEVGDKKITADEIAELCGTISYEILLDFSKRVPRKYK